jgi:hypothetical protein
MIMNNTSSIKIISIDEMVVDIEAYLPNFKNKWEAIDNAIKFAKDNTKFMYPVYAYSQGPFRPADMLRDVFGIRTLVVGFHDEVTYEPIWCEAYMMCFTRDMIIIPDKGECQVLKLVRGVEDFIFFQESFVKEAMKENGDIFQHLEDNFIL